VKYNLKIQAILLTSVLLLSFSGCNSTKLQGKNPTVDTNITNGQTQVGTTVIDSSSSSSETSQAIDYSAVKPNESGRIMIVMFHNFVESYKSGDKYYTTTFDTFRGLLGNLYDSDYRLINLNDYLDNNIKTAAGYKPIIFTFDDGTPGQFNLVEENGNVTANRQSAVGIMEEFYKTHPDFGLAGTFFVNLGDNTFTGKGTVADRLKYLVDEGFEIGNHTYTHINLKNTKDSATIQKEIGGNQKKMYELIPGYKFKTFSLPYGLPSKDLQQYVAKGIYEGVEYENQGIMEVGWDPAQAPSNVKYNPLSIHRVRASGIVPVDADLAWWLKQKNEKNQYVSDGNPDTVVVPQGMENLIDKNRVGTRKLIVYPG
jgi:Predicted xylanase/chitin deacetylase